MRTKSTEHHNTSLRLPMQWHKFMEQFAEKWNVPTSYVYRQAIQDFIKLQTHRNQHNPQ
jgi:predicted transcriptional regulator